MPEAAGMPQAQPTVAHVAGVGHCYLGETVSLHTRVLVNQRTADLTLRISLPISAELRDQQPPEQFREALPVIEEDEAARYVVWRLQGALPIGSAYEYQVDVLITDAGPMGVFESRAELSDADGTRLAAEVATVVVHTKGSYLRYLPEIYEDDALMARFLMLFESFWAPIDRQISSLHWYFNPDLTPGDFLPWLASWMDLALDERLPDERRRRLVRSAVPLYRKRGTRRGLQEYLEIYTGSAVQVIEYRAANLRLGSEARLGYGVALGKGNVPHTFTVVLHLPPVDSAGGLGKDEVTRRETERLRMIRALIDAEKPAHTAYDLRVEVTPANEVETF